MRPTPLHALTSARFVFAMMVVGTHFVGYRPTDLVTWIGPLGNIAVSWFFVLSGFILTYNFPSLETWRDRGKFVVSRFWRLFPVQAVTLAISLALFASSRHLMETQPYYLFRSLSLTHTWDASPFTGQAFNVPAWSISHEMFFYLAFPLLIALRRRIAAAIVVACTLTALGWAAGKGCFDSSVAFNAPGDSYSPTCISIVFYWPIARLWEFALGMAICDMRPRFSKAMERRPRLQITLCLTLCAIFVLQAVVRNEIVMPYFAVVFGFWAGTTVIGAFLILVLSMEGPVSNALSGPALLFAGEISFSVYMTHMLIIRFAMDNGIGTTLYAPIQFAAISATAIALSAAIYLGVEKPSRAWLKAVFRHSPGRQGSRPASAG